ncbi:hypothetical protein LLG10_03395 [bacterium]|nr:hypothetical protein [bacterium]
MEIPSQYADYGRKKRPTLCAILSPSGFTKRIVHFVAGELKRMSYAVEITRKQFIS